MLSLAAVVPHGDEILSPEDEESQRLHRAMVKLGDLIRERDVKGYILITPHNIRIDTHIGIILTEYASGSWKYGKIRIRRKIRCMRDLAREIYEKSKKEGVPVVGINFGALEGTYSNMPLDWGSLIPLYFLPRREIVLITPARGIGRDELVRFGNIIADVVENKREKFALIVSADHAHAHSHDGPYGFSPYAEEYDKLVVDAMKSGNLISLMNLDEKLIQEAKPDSYWQLLILGGVLEKLPMRNLFAEYGLPTYFGMAVAVYTR